MFDFNVPKDLRVFVSAGAAGIGRAIAEKFHAAGAKIYVCDVSEAAVKKCLEDHPDWHASICDVSKQDQVEAMFAEIESIFGGLDVLVNNAGIAGPTGGIDEIDPDHWRSTIDINLNGQYYCARMAVPLLRKSSHGNIICLSSIAGRLGYANRTPYAATKWAIRGLTESLAAELGADNIRVNAILPGIVEGPRIDHVIQARADKEGVSFEEMSQQYKNMASLKRMVTAEDVAMQALFLCSGAAKNITGQCISVDGYVKAL